MGRKKISRCVLLKMTKTDDAARTTDRSAGDPPAAAGATRPRFGSVTSAPLWANLVATFFGAGRMKPGPGTWGSIATILVWTAIAWQLPVSYRTPVAILISLTVIAIGIPAATAVARAAGRKDPQWVVIDETAGQLIALIGVPLAWKTFLAGLILFRVFDILKPPPVRQLERLPEGTGIVMDDVAAGLYALGIMHLLLWFGVLTG